MCLNQVQIFNKSVKSSLNILISVVKHQVLIFNKSVKSSLNILISVVKH